MKKLYFIIINVKDFANNKLIVEIFFKNTVSKQYQHPSEIVKLVEELNVNFRSCCKADYKEWLAENLLCYYSDAVGVKIYPNLDLHKYGTGGYFERDDTSSPIKIGGSLNNSCVVTGNNNTIK